MNKLVILGCGGLANVVVNAIIGGLLPDYQVVGLFSRSKHRAELMAMRLQADGHTSVVCDTVEELLALKADYLVETASVAAMREYAIGILNSGTSIITISIGALADELFYTKLQEAAKGSGARVYIASGATGGFDVLRTATLMGNASAHFLNKKGANALRGTAVYEESLQREQRVVFSGNAKEAIALFPTRVNVAVAASLASVGAQDMQVSMQSIPGFIGDTQRVEIRNDQVHAVIDVHSATAEIAGWSIVSTLINIVSPVVF